MKEELLEYPVIVEIPVQWGDMDAAQHVNNLIYLRWSETARISYFEKIGMDISFTADDAGPILGWQDCKYIFPMTFPDTAIIGIKVDEIKEDRFITKCAVFSKRHQRISAVCHNAIIPYNYKTLKKVPVPQLWLDAINGNI